jgi:RNA polymerase sigma factor (sigma-70 family)
VLSEVENRGDERSIWEDLVAGSERFLYVFVKKRLRGFLVPLDVVKDVVQQTYAVGWRKRRHFFGGTDRKAFSSWLVVIAMGEIKNYLRSEWREVRSLGKMRRIEDLLGTPMEPWVKSRSPDIALEAEERACVLERALASLSPEAQELLRRYYIQGTSLWDLARERRVTIDAIRMKINRSHARFVTVTRRILEALPP